MDVEFLRQICLEVGPDKSVIAGYDSLACQLKVPSDVMAKCKRKTQHSPTRGLFDTLAVDCEDLLVETLLCKLSEIKKNNAVKIVKEYIPGKKVINNYLCFFCYLEESI